MAYAADRRRGLTTLDIAEPDPDEYKRRIREAQEAGSGPVKVGVDPSVFEWVRPQSVGRRQRPAGITITTQAVALTPAADELLGRPERVVFGLAARALAIRVAEPGEESYSVYRKRKGGRVSGGAQVMSRAISQMLRQRGWPGGELIPVRYNEEHRMLVAVLPKGAGREVAGRG